MLRFYPDPDRRDALTGPPRRLPAAEPDEFALPDFAGIGAGGWSNIGQVAFNDVFAALSLAQRPVTDDELLDVLGFNPENEVPVQWDTVVCRPGTEPLVMFGNERDEVLRALEVAAEMPEVRTQADVVECLLRLEVLTRSDRADGRSVIAVNPQAPPAYGVLDVSPGWRAHLLIESVRDVLGDLTQVVRWAPDARLVATPRQVADRLAVTTAQVRGAAEVLLANGRLRSSTDFVDLDDDAEFELVGDPWNAPVAAEPSAPLALGRPELVALVGEHLSAEEGEAWLSDERPSARLVRARDGDAVAAVLGGLPHLPVDVDWPRWGDAPLPFLASVELTALHAVLPDAPLPVDGSLLFFGSSDAAGPGPVPVPFVSAMFPASRPGWRVIHVPAGTPTSERPAPETPTDEGFVVHGRVECALALEPTLPDPYAFVPARRHGLDDGRVQAFTEAKWSRYDRAAGPRHRVGGWADPSQTEPAAPVALAAAGLVGPDGEVDHDDPHVRELADRADDDWFLLLQLDTDEGSDGTGWMWGDAGVMFFYARPDAIASGDFTDVWMNWDCS